MYITKTNKGKLSIFIMDSIEEVKRIMKTEYIDKGLCTSYKIYETTYETYEHDYRDLGGEL